MVELVVVPNLEVELEVVVEVDPSPVVVELVVEVVVGWVHNPIHAYFSPALLLRHSRRHIMPMPPEISCSRQFLNFDFQIE
jgi:hypothetical protein